MRLLFSVGHPAHVHAYKNLIWELRKRGHEIIIAARDKEMTLDLLDNYGFDYQLVSSRKKGKIGLGIEMIQRHYKFFNILRRFRPDITISPCDPSMVQIGKMLGIPSIIMADSSLKAIKFPPMNLLVTPFATVIFTLSSVIEYEIDDFGSKGVEINSYKELAYLHPDHFTPDQSVLAELGMNKTDIFIIMRFIAWQAGHDTGKYGFDMETKRRLVNDLGKYGRVFITSENPLPAEFEKYRITIQPEKIHDLLYYATLLICDSQTMATEAAVLGTPVVRCNSIVGPNDMGNFIELERKYDLIYSIREPDKAIMKAAELLQQPDLKEQWAKKRQLLLADKVNMTKFMVDFIENYPESFRKYREKSD